MDNHNSIMDIKNGMLDKIIDIHDWMVGVNI